MADYKKMYLTLSKAVDVAMEILKNATLECEDIYVETDENDEDPEEEKARLLKLGLKTIDLNSLE